MRDLELELTFNNLKKYRMKTTGVPSLDARVRKEYGEWLNPPAARYEVITKKISFMKKIKETGEEEPGTMMLRKMLLYTESGNYHITYRGKTTQFIVSSLESGKRLYRIDGHKMVMFLKQWFNAPQRLLVDFWS